MEDLQFGANFPAVSAPVVSISELAEYETPVSTTPVPAVAWSMEKHMVAQFLATKGMSKVQVSRETGVPLSAINKWLQNSEFTSYINQIVLDCASVMKAKRLGLLSKILDARIEEAERTGDYARLSKMDTLDIISAIRKETGDEDAAKESSYTRIMEKFLEINNRPAAPAPPIDITPK